MDKTTYKERLLWVPSSPGLDDCHARLQLSLVGLTKCVVNCVVVMVAYLILPRSRLSDEPDLRCVPLAISLPSITRLVGK